MTQPETHTHLNPLLLTFLRSLYRDGNYDLLPVSTYLSLLSTFTTHDMLKFTSRPNDRRRHPSLKEEKF